MKTKKILSIFIAFQVLMACNTNQSESKNGVEQKAAASSHTTFDKLTALKNLMNKEPGDSLLGEEYLGKRSCY